MEPCGAGLSTGPPPAPLRREASGPVGNPDTSCRDPLLRQAAEVDRIRRLAAKRAMRPAGVVEGQIRAQAGLGGRHRVVGFRYTSSYFTLFQRRSTNTLSHQQPLPPMLMAMPCSLSRSVKSPLVNWLP